MARERRPEGETPRPRLSLVRPWNQVKREDPQRFSHAEDNPEKKEKKTPKDPRTDAT